MSENDNLQQYLPDNLRTRGATCTRVASGLSGARVYRVQTGDDAYILKIAKEADDVAPPHIRERRARIQQVAGEIGVAPCVLHVDEEFRAVLTTFVQDRSFAALYGTPATRGAALQQLARTLHSVHAMDLRDAPPGNTPESFLDSLWSVMGSQDEMPAFVIETVDRVRSLARPETNAPLVLSHNDVNPSNIMYDGARVLLLDWEMCAPGDPYYDLAAAAVFFRMDDATCIAFLEAYDGTIFTSVPQRFRYNQALVAALCGSTFLTLRLTNGFTAAVTRETVLSLSEIYVMMRTGTLDISSADGQMQFGLALLKAADEYVSLATTPPL